MASFFSESRCILFRVTSTSIAVSTTVHLRLCQTSQSLFSAANIFTETTFRYFKAEQYKLFVSRTTITKVAAKSEKPAAVTGHYRWQNRYRVDDLLFVLGSWLSLTTNLRVTLMQIPSCSSSQWRSNMLRVYPLQGSKQAFYQSIFYLYQTNGPY